MVKLVLLHKVGSGYDDQPETVYDFPKRYLKDARLGTGDWIVFYEPAKPKGRGYFAVAKIDEIVPNEKYAGRFLAKIADQSYLEFDQPVPRLRDGRTWESMLMTPAGDVNRGGRKTESVRIIPEAEFAAIVAAGLPEDLIERETRQYDRGLYGIGEGFEGIERPVIERLTSRPYRDVAFRRKVRGAYDYRCAISGLRLRNGGGRPEVQAAHIRPVERQGSDSVRNGLALSGTLHWMFDRGLLSVADDMTILVSRNKVPREVSDRLIAPEGKLHLPHEERDWPHCGNLRWHRENVFGQLAFDGPAPWG